MRKRTFSLLLAALGLAAACNSAPTGAPAAVPTTGIDIAGMDKSTAPGDDFNAYANGGWIKATPIPPDKASYGIFAILADDTRKRTVSLIISATPNMAGLRAKYREHITAMLNLAGFADAPARAPASLRWKRRLPAFTPRVFNRRMCTRRSRGSRKSFPQKRRVSIGPSFLKRRD